MRDITVISSRKQLYEILGFSLSIWSHYRTETRMSGFNGGNISREMLTKEGKLMSNEISNRGFGLWTIVTYNPLRAIGPIKGTLNVDSKFHTIQIAITDSKGVKKTRSVFTCSSLNVAYCINELYFREEHAILEVEAQKVPYGGKGEVLIQEEESDE